MPTTRRLSAARHGGRVGTSRHPTETQPPFKRRYDLINLFRMNQNIRPAAMG